MSTIMASYTTVASPSPAVQLQASSLLLACGSWKPAVALRPSAALKCRRRALTVTCALPEKERPPAFSIPPTALLCPVPPPDGKERWDIKEEDDRVTLWLQVPGLSASDIEVTTGEDVLEIKRSVTAQQPAPPVDAHGVGAFHIRLLLTKEYDGKNVAADLKAGMLEVTVPKHTERPGGQRVVLGALRTTPTPTPTATPTLMSPSPPRGNDSSTRKGPQPQERKPEPTTGRQNTNGV